jgi:hypothetical protein
MTWWRFTIGQPPPPSPGLQGMPLTSHRHAVTTRWESSCALRLFRDPLPVRSIPDSSLIHARFCAGPISTCTGRSPSETSVFAQGSPGALAQPIVPLELSRGPLTVASVPPPRCRAGHLAFLSFCQVGRFPANLPAPPFGCLLVADGLSGNPFGRSETNPYRTPLVRPLPPWSVGNEFACIH